MLEKVFYNVKDGRIIKAFRRPKGFDEPALAAASFLVKGGFLGGIAYLFQFARDAAAAGIDERDITAVMADIAQTFEEYAEAAYSQDLGDIPLEDMTGGW